MAALSAGCIAYPFTAKAIRAVFCEEKSGSTVEEKQKLVAICLHAQNAIGEFVLFQYISKEGHDKLIWRRYIEDVFKPYIVDGVKQVDMSESDITELVERIAKKRFSTKIGSQNYTFVKVSKDVIDTKVFRDTLGVLDIPD
jgi:hypothetical protein